MNESNSSVIARNRKASYEYFLETRYEAGLVLQGWEVKSIRAGRVQIAEAYVSVRDGQALVHGMHISPLTSASSHVDPEPDRNRILLLHDREISEIYRATQTRGRTCVVTRMYWSRHRVKCEVATGTGKKRHDKREAIKERDWERETRRVWKNR